MSSSVTFTVFVAEFYRERLIRLVAQAIEKSGIDGRRLFPDQAGERRTLGAVPLAGGAQAAVQVTTLSAVAFASWSAGSLAQR